MTVSLDLRKAYKSHAFGDIIQVLTWVNDERAMVLMPRHRKNAPWYIVCESASFKYDDVRYLASQCKKAAEVLGMGADRTTWSKLATIIIEGLPDLIRMPSAPPTELRSTSHGAMTLKGDGQVLAQEDIRFEKEGASYG